MTVPRSEPVAFRTTYIGWIIAILVVLVSLLGMLGVVPASPPVVFGCILGLAVAVFLA